MVLKVESVFAAGRFFAHLPFYLHKRVSLEEARRGLERRLSNRPARLLDRFKSDIYKRPGSVYHSLLKHCGIEYGDLEAMVRADGVEGSLQTLFRAGVYLTVDEFKGRKALVRGSLRLDVDSDQLRSPRASYQLRGSSGGSRSQGTPILMDLKFVRDCGANCSLVLDAWGLKNPVKADYESPGAGARFRLVKLSSFGDRPRGWFSQLRSNDPSNLRITGWNTIAMRASGLLAGRPFPKPVYAPLSSPLALVRWLEGVVRDGDTPLVWTFPGSAVRVCVIAKQQGINIANTRFLISGEPITKARVTTIRKAGAIPIPRYGTMEVGAIGYGCKCGTYSDDLHLVSDMQALIQAQEEGERIGLPSNAILLTALHSKSPFLMINVSMGDQADIGQSTCGCPLQELGWITRVHSVGSFEKLTGGGVTFLGTDVVRILDDFLPARFGGKPTDYQLVEKEAADGQPVLELLASPTVGDLDERELGESFLQEMAKGPAPAPRMVKVWRESDTLRVVRKTPVISKAGKILHLHRS